MTKKVKSKDVKNIYGKKCGNVSNVPNDICPVLKRLDALEFVNRIIPGTFRKSHNGKGINIIGYDESKKNYHISISAGGYEQRMVLGVQDKKSEYEGLIKKCG